MLKREQTSSEIVNNFLRGIVRMKNATGKKFIKYKPDLRKLTIGARVRIARLSMCFDVRQFAERLKTQPANVSNIENGKHEPRRQTIEKISELTGFDPEWFYKS